MPPINIEYRNTHLLHHLAYKNQAKLLEHLLSGPGLGALNAYAQEIAVPLGKSHVTPLLAALRNGSCDAAKVLLNHKASLSGFMDGQYNALYLAACYTSRDFVEYLIQYARENNQLEELMGYSHIQDGTHTLIEDGYKIIVDTLIDGMLKGEVKYFKISDLSTLASPIRKYFTDKYKGPSPHIQMQESFDKEVKNPNDKKTAIKNVLIAFYEILQMQDFCCMHLQELEKEIIKIANGFLPSKHLCKDFAEKFHMNYTYPVPNPGFKPLKLESLLKKAILNILQRHGLGNTAVKLVGFIPDEIMRILINEGTYLSENRLDLKLILHGKISHMIQWALLCILIEKGEIKITYGQDQKLTFIEILQAMVSNEPIVTLDKNSFFTLWEQMIDTAYLSHVNFQDPYHVNSYLMQDNYFNQLPELRACLINSHCKAMIACAKYYSALFDETITPQMLWDNMMSLTVPSKIGYCDTRTILAAQKNPEVRYPDPLEQGSSYLVLTKYTGTIRDNREESTSPIMGIKSEHNTLVS